LVDRELLCHGFTSSMRLAPKQANLARRRSVTATRQFTIAEIRQISLSLCAPQSP
jgi:hypothetical protein